MLGLDAPLRTIYCIGRNYAKHAKELGHEVPTAPLVFLKPAAALLRNGETLVLPKASAQVDHEVEVVVSVDTDGTVKYAIGVDFTARDLQTEAKKKGEPWTLSKGLRGFAAIGPFVDAAAPLTFSLSVNGEVRQRGDTKDMVFAIPKLLAYVDETFGLGPGDVIFTGTPAGVAPLKPGDEIKAELSGTTSLLRIKVA